MKVVTSCYGRFHIYPQAAQLHRHGRLHRFINAYPKFLSRKYGIPDEKVDSMLALGVVGRLAAKSFRWLDADAFDAISEKIHNRFSKSLAARIPGDTDIFIGLSSFCLDAIEEAKRRGMRAIVDHGSLHQRIERELQREELEIWGLPGSSCRLAAQWLVDKEDEEFSAADKIIVLSKVAARSMMQAGVPAEKLFVNHCGVDLSEFYPGEKRDGVFRVIQCGGIHTGKGVQYLLKAFHELALPQSELWFIGSGVETSPLQDVIRKFAADNIHFKGGYPQSELRELYNQGSLFVLASISDGFGMVVTQAMACGLPVIVTENVGAADLVEDGVNGHVIPIRDVDSLKEKILFHYENRECGEAMGKSALAKISSGLGWDGYGDRLVDFLDTL